MIVKKRDLTHEIPLLNYLISDALTSSLSWRVFEQPSLPYQPLQVKLLLVVLVLRPIYERQRLPLSNPSRARSEPSCLL
jgi:hypothetical protein